MDLRDLTKRFLQKNDLTVAFMARKVGISHTSLSRWLNGERTLASDTIQDIKCFLNGDFVQGMGELLEAEEFYSD